MIKKILLVGLLLCSSLFAKEDIKLKEKHYIITNKDKLFKFNGYTDKYIEFRLDKNIIFNKSFNTGYKLENNKLRIYESYNVFVNKYSERFEEWNIDYLSNNSLSKKDCYRLYNKQYDLLLCED